MKADIHPGLQGGRDDHLRLRVRRGHAVDSRQLLDRRLLDVSSVLHGQAQDHGRRRSCRPLPPQVRGKRDQAGRRGACCRAGRRSRPRREDRAGPPFDHREHRPRCAATARRARVFASMSQAEPARPYIGGQAVIEGVMMRSPGSLSVVCRRRSGELVVREQRGAARTPKGVRSWPLVRGVTSVVEALKLGSRALRFSAGKSSTKRIYAKRTPRRLRRSRRSGAGTLHSALALGRSRRARDPKRRDAGSVPRWRRERRRQEERHPEGHSDPLRGRHVRAASAARGRRRDAALQARPAPSRRPAIRRSRAPRSSASSSVT